MRISATVLIYALAAFAVITVNVDQSVFAASTDRYFVGGVPSVDTSWSLTSGGAGGASVPADTTDVFLDGNGNSAFTLGGNVSWRALNLVAAYTANFSASGRTVTTKYGITTDGTGTYNFGNGLVVDSAGATLHIGAGVGTVSATSCAIAWNGESGIMDIDKATTFKSYSGKGFTNSGAATSTFINTGVPLVLTGGTLQINRTALFVRTTSGQMFTLTGSNALRGAGTAGTLGFNNGAKFTKDTLPAITFLGPGTLQFSNQIGDSSGECHLGGDVVCDSGSFKFFASSSASPNMLFKNNGYDITVANNFMIGCNISSSGFIGVFDSATITIGMLNGVLYNNGAVSCTLSAVTWIVDSSYTYGSIFNVVTEGCTHNFISAKKSIVTTEREPFDNIRVAKSSGAIAEFVGTLLSGDIGIDSGTAIFDSVISADITIASGKVIFDSAVLCVDFTCNNIGDSVIINSAITVSGNVHIAEGVHVKFGVNGSLTLTSKGATLTANESLTIPSLTLTDSTFTTVGTGKTITLTTYDIEGSAGNLVSWSGGTLALPAVDTVSYMRVTGVAASPSAIYALDGTSVDGGGNVGVYFPAGPVSTNRQKRYRLGFGFGY